MKKSLGQECLRISDPRLSKPLANTELYDLITEFYQQYQEALQKHNFSETSRIDDLKLEIITIINTVNQSLGLTRDQSLAGTIANNIRTTLNLIFQLARLAANLVQNESEESQSHKNQRLSEVLKEKINAKDIARVAFSSGLKTITTVHHLNDEHTHFSTANFQLDSNRLVLSSRGETITASQTVNNMTYRGCPATRIKLEGSRQSIIVQEAETILQILAENWKPFI